MCYLFSTERGWVGIAACVCICQPVYTIKAKGRTERSVGARAHWDSGHALQRFPGWLDYSGNLPEREATDNPAKLPAYSQSSHGLVPVHMLADGWTHNEDARANTVGHLNTTWDIKHHLKNVKKQSGERLLFTLKRSGPDLIYIYFL